MTFVHALMIILFKVEKQSWFINQVTRFHHLFMYIFINFTRIPYIGILQKIPKQNTNRCHNHGTWHKVGWWVFRRNVQTASVLRGALQKTCWDRKFTACLLKPMIALGNSRDFSHFFNPPIFILEVPERMILSETPCANPPVQKKFWKNYSSAIFSVNNSWQQHGSFRINIATDIGEFPDLEMIWCKSPP